MSPRRQEPTRGKLLDATLVPPTKRRATSPLPAALREDVIELLSRLLLAEIARDPAAYHTGPDGGRTVASARSQDHGDPLPEEQAR